MPRHLTRSLVAALAVMLAACSMAAADDTATGGAMDPREAAGLLADRSELVVVDVRTPEEFEVGHLEGARLIDARSVGFQAELEALDRDEPYLVYCRTGNRSGEAAALMHELGFAEVYDAGGLAELAAAGARVSR
jgi:phage shock protein E